MYNDVKELISFIEAQRRMLPKVSLDRFRKICEIYKNPQENLKYIHVGGTNGKGSTVNYVKNILREAGFNVATYISPYIIKFNERINYNHEYITDEELLNIGNYILSKYPLLKENGIENLSFFEFVTLLAFIYFSRLKDLDFVIVEVGLGGLLDVTNIITPLISVITNINYDHMNVLGNTIEEIAINKLGIVKERIPLITIENEEINSLIIKTTKEKNSDLIILKPSEIKDISLSLDKTTFSYKEFKNISLKMLGKYQTENASLALEVINVLNNKYKYLISNDAIYSGLEKSYWPGRLDVVSKNPVIILDGAHNIDGIIKLAEFIKVIKAEKLVKIIFAVSSNKQKEDMINVIEEIADEMIFSSFHYGRSDTSENLLHFSHHKNVRVEDDLEKLVSEAKEANNYINVFCGSLYFVSELYPMLKK